MRCFSSISEVFEKVTTMSPLKMKNVTTKSVGARPLCELNVNTIRNIKPVINLVNKNTFSSTDSEKAAKRLKCNENSKCKPIVDAGIDKENYDSNIIIKLNTDKLKTIETPSKEHAAIENVPTVNHKNVKCDIKIEHNAISPSKPITECKEEIPVPLTVTKEKETKENDVFSDGKPLLENESPASIHYKSEPTILDMDEDSISTQFDENLSKYEPSEQDYDSSELDVEVGLATVESEQTTTRSVIEQPTSSPGTVTSGKYQSFSPSATAFYQTNKSNKGAAAPPMSRRNARERNRVRQVSQGFAILRQHVPQASRRKKLSKVETLRCAVDYIRALKKIVDETDENGKPLTKQRNGPMSQNEDQLSRTQQQTLKSVAVSESENYQHSLISHYKLQNQQRTLIPINQQQILNINQNINMNQEIIVGSSSLSVNLQPLAQDQSVNYTTVPLVLDPLVFKLPTEEVKNVQYLRYDENTFPVPLSSGSSQLYPGHPHPVSVMSGHITEESSMSTSVSSSEGSSFYETSGSSDQEAAIMMDCLPWWQENL